MEQMDLNTVQSLFEKALTDKNAAVKILRLYSHSMLDEANLYLSEDSAAKEAALQSFRIAYPHLSETDASHLKNWLNHYVQTECISRILPLKISAKIPYTDTDEKPVYVNGLPQEPERMRKYLRMILSKMSESERIVLVLKYRDQLSFEQIAEICKCSVKDVQYVLSESKQFLKNKNVNVNAMLWMVNQLYPYYKKEPAEEDNTQEIPIAREPDEEEIFNTSVNELKLFFTQKIQPTESITDRDIDDSEDMHLSDDGQPVEFQPIRKVESNTIDDTASSAKAIIAATASGSESRAAKKYGYGADLRKWIILGVAGLALVALIVLAVVLIIHGHNKAPNAAQVSQQPEITETADVSEETVIPEETDLPEEMPEESEEPEDTDPSIGTAYVRVTDLTIRSGPGVAYEQSGMADPETDYPVYEVAEADGYTWYRVSDDEWIADLNGQFVTYTPKE